MTRFKPTTAQLELLCEHASARIPASVTAKALGVEIDDLQELARRLEVGHALVANPPPPDGENGPSIWAAFPTMNK